MTICLTDNLCWQIFSFTNCDLLAYLSISIRNDKHPHSYLPPVPSISFQSGHSQISPMTLISSLDKNPSIHKNSSIHTYFSYWLTSPNWYISDLRRVQMENTSTRISLSTYTPYGEPTFPITQWLMRKSICVCMIYWGFNPGPGTCFASALHWVTSQA